MLRVLLITQNFSPEIGSAANRLTKLYESLSNESEIEVSVLTSNPRYPNKKMYEENPIFKRKLDSQTRIECISPFFKKYHKNLVLRLIFYLEFLVKGYLKGRKLAQNADVVVATTPNFFSGVLGVLLKKKKLILDVRDLWPKSVEGLKKNKSKFLYKAIYKIAYKAEKWMYQSADHLVINSEGFLSHLLYLGINKEKITFIPNPITFEELEKGSNYLEKNKEMTTTKVVYAGNVGRAQEMGPLIKLIDVYKNSTEHTFTIIPYGVDTEAFIQQIKKINASNVRILKPKPREIVFDYLVNATIGYVGLIDIEEFHDVIPGKIIDYFGSGTAIIANLEGYSQKIIEQSNGGVTMEDSSTVHQLMVNRQMQYDLARNGLIFAREHYSWEKNYQQFLKIIKGI
ncbi:MULTISPECIES: glycosyltransferase family 4 protein [Enterococcus]|uniref:glycosyltransferase family 4 protein n=1 Tax=Enterococcus TaxID=1350 RepID=UPI0007C1DCFB|nr:glycosyltransferase family 4 protein [Enterococcus hirae]AND73251.1 hypothetical protein A6P53_10490 [Enterococcus hirae]